MSKDAARGAPVEVTQANKDAAVDLAHDIGLTADQFTSGMGDKFVRAFARYRSTKPLNDLGELAAFGASEAAYYLYPNEDQQPERLAFCEGAAQAVRQADLATPPVSATASTGDVVERAREAAEAWRISSDADGTGELVKPKDDCIWGYAQGFAAALSAPLDVPPGWKLVPVEPTPEMRQAALKVVLRYNDGERAYAAMIATAPSVTESLK